MGKRSSTIVNYVLLIGLTLIALLALPELFVRLLVPKEVFWPISNIYQQSDLPGVFYTYRPNFSGLAFGVDLETNSLGFRGPEWEQEKTDAFRIACIGDSHTFGYGVAFEDAFCEQTARRLEQRTKVEVESLNFGVNGYNARQLRAVTEHLVQRFEPDLYLFVFANNDQKPNFVADADGWLYWDPSLETEARVQDHSLELLQPAAMPWYLEHSRALLYFKIWSKKSQLQTEAQSERLDRSAPPAKNWMGPFKPSHIVSERLSDTVYRPLLDMISIARGQEAKVVIATVCTAPDYRQMFQKVSLEHDIPVLELLTLFPESTSWPDLLEKFGLGWDPHLNAKGHARWAEALSVTVEQQLDRKS